MPYIHILSSPFKIQIILQFLVAANFCHIYFNPFLGKCLGFSLFFPLITSFIANVQLLNKIRRTIAGATISRLLLTESCINTIINE